MRNFAKVIAPHILNLWCDEFFQNLVFYILNRVVLIKSCFPHHPSPPSSSKMEMQHAARKEVGAVLQKLGNQDLEAQKCWYNIDSQPTAHTFMFRAL
jgi:hypothetical protein